MLRKLFLILLLMVLFISNCYADNSYLVGDLGIVKPDMTGILIAKDKPMAQPLFYHKAEPVYDRTKVDGDVTVTTEIEYDGVVQSKEDAERSGFFSIVTAKDL